MRIGIDIQTTLGQKTGFGFYVKNLVQELKKVGRGHQYWLFAPGSEKDFSAPQRWWWDQMEIPRRALESKVDILHQPTFSAPVFYPGKVVVTVHDLIAMIYGKDIPFFSRQFFGRWMPFSYGKASKIIAISQSTKRDLVRLLGISESKITVIPLAYGPEFKPINNKKLIQSVLAHYHIRRPYLLHVGTLNPRKNLNFLIRVFAEIVKRHPHFNLVLTGKFGWYYEELFSLTRQLGLSQKVIFTGYVRDGDAPVLYNGATLFAFPTLYEGFGLPALEAMACGVPVIASNVSSIPEVVGGAGQLLLPDDLAGWTKAVGRIIENKQVLAKMRTASLKQAKKFSWRKTALSTIAVYEKAL